MIRSIAARAAAFLFSLTAASQAGQVVFSEVMYAPPTGKPEFLEVWNISMTPLDMAKWQFTSGISYTFPDFDPANTGNHFLKQNERIIVSSADEATTRAAYPSIPGTVRVFGPWTGNLNNAGEVVTLDDKNGVHACTLEYGDSNPWPRAADGTGHSLVLKDENRDINDWRFWRASTENGGSPGQADPEVPAVTLALSEVHFNNNNAADWVELRNPSATAAAVQDGFFLASKTDLSDKVPLTGNLAAGTYGSVTVNFPADGSGEVTVFLVDNGNRVREVVHAKSKNGRNSYQRFPADSDEWYQSLTDSRNAANNPARQTGVVINEIMADPPSNQRDGEFIELYNRTAAAIDLSGWKFDDGVDYTFPAGTSIPAGGYVVVAANATWLNGAYPGLTALGNWSGSLSNGGERLRLEDADGNLADEVDYHMGGEWPDLAGGDGSSLELMNPDMDNSKGGAWRASDEKSKGQWQSFTINGGTYRDLTMGGTNDDEIRLWLVGDGHLVLRNLVLQTVAGGPNLLVNGNVTTLANNNTSGWQCRGTHYASFSDDEGVHIVADGHGDNKANHIEKSATGMTSGTSYRLTGEVRWIYGKPRIIAQSWDTSWGGTTLAVVPLNLGTPGKVNSRFAAAPAPIVTAGLHSPAVPRTTDGVTITAKVVSATPLTSVVVKHRLDNVNANAVWASLPMNDSGTAGDAVAGDGIYTLQLSNADLATLTYATAGRIVQFYVEATADNGSVGTFPRDGVATPGMWVVDNQTPAKDLRRIKVIISAYWADALATNGATVKFNYKFPRLSNHYYPCVFISNDSEIYYGSYVRKTGSPFTRGTDNSLDRARIDVPADHPFRGNTKLYWDNDSNGGSMLHNRIHRYWLYLFGVNGVQNEVCRISKNNTAYTVRETSEVFDKDLLDRLWENGSNSWFYEVDDKFWIGDDGTTLLTNQDASWDYNPANSPGAENPVSYQNNYIPKSRENDYDFSQLIEWFRQIETRATAMSQAQMESMVDIRQMAAYAAVRGYSADWDNWTINRGKNGFLINRSTDHKWVPMHWDSDLSFDSGQAGIPVVGSLTNIPTFYARPFVRRYLNYYLTKMLGEFAPNQARLKAWIAAEEAVSTGYSVPSTYASWATGSRPNVLRTFIGTATLNATFALTNPPATADTPTVDITGTAPAAAYEVICVDHPEAVFAWTGTSATTTTLWKATGIQLAEGTNTLVFRMLDASGVQVGSDVTQVITKTGNSPPVTKLTSDPSSQNIALGHNVLLDAGGTRDPENASPISYAWTIAPESGWTLVAATDTTRNLVFSKPGTYTVTVQATDPAGKTASAALDLTAYNDPDFDSFSGDFLTPYTLTGVKLLDNYSPDTWVSLHEIDNNLLLHVSDSAARPLAPDGPTGPGFPRVAKTLPASGDFILQTDFTLADRQFGSFLTGLYLETTESGVPVRYAFGLQDGLNIALQKASGEGGTYSSVGTVAFTGGTPPPLRISRTGTTLNFQQRLTGTWATVQSVTLPAGSTAGNGGLFTATTTAQTVKTAFDYLLLANPADSSSLVQDLRVTEIMYKPAGNGVEFLELGNIGTQPLNLKGVYFDDGKPFDLFTFGDITLQAGGYIVVTQDLAGFRALYGNAIAVAGQYSGALNNGGERILLKDPQGNTIQDFTYGSSAPWPVTPDGGGPSLQVVSTTGDYNNSANWVASAKNGGTPGTGTGVNPNLDSDGDGQTDSMETAFGTNPNNPSSFFAITSITRNATGQPVLTWPGVTTATYTVQVSADLTTNSWQSLGTVPGTAPTATFTDTTAPPPSRRFYRIQGTTNP